LTQAASSGEGGSKTQNAIDFVKYTVEMFPFRIHTIRTDRGHEFQALFHWYVEDQGMRHVYIKPRSPQLNGKVERSHRSDQVAIKKRIMVHSVSKRNKADSGNKPKTHR